MKPIAAPLSLVLRALSALVLAAGPAGAAAEPLAVHTTFYPTTYLAERLGGDLVRVTCPVPEDADPLFWKPDADALRAFQRADLVVLNGAGLEQWVERVSLPFGRVVDTSRAFHAELLVHADAVTHSHGAEGEHSHAGLDAHVWLDPLLFRRQAEAVHSALARHLREEGAREGLDARLEALGRDLAALDAELRGLGELPEGVSLYASHPAYDYLARRYGWRVENLDLDPGEMPPPEVLAAVAARLEQRPGTHLVWESSPEPAIAQRIADELGLRSLVFSPCEALTASESTFGDGLSSMVCIRVVRRS